MIKQVISDNEWNPVDGMILEENALSTIREDHNVLVIAGPGAGKTELLAQKACYLLQTNKCIYPKKILAISFKKDAAENLKERVEKRCGKELAGRFISLTYDAFAKSILDRFRRGLTSEYQPIANYLVNEDKEIMRAFEDSGFIRNRSQSVSKLKTYFYNQLAAVKLPIDINEIETTTSKAWRLLLKGNDNINSCLTFQVISRLAEFIIRSNPRIKKSLTSTYSYVFLDEFQDTTEIQYEFMKTCFINSNTNLTAVGDRKQRIMLWAGALDTVFDDFKVDFISREKPLLMNHRSAPKLVELQRRMYESLKDEPKEITFSKKWNYNDGEINLYKFSSYTNEAEYIADDILKKYSSGTKLKEICILTKQTPQAYTNDLIYCLMQRGIKARIENDYQDLLKEPLTLLIINFLYLVPNTKRPSSWELIMNYLNALYLDDIVYDYDIIRNKQKEMINIIKKSKKSLENCKEVFTFTEVVMNILDFYGIENLKSMYSNYSQGNLFEKILDSLINLLWEEYIQANNWKLAIENFEGKNSVPIMTIHKSKGLEFEIVYFIGLEDSAFWNFQNQPMEDRCAFFVALSRAKISINFTFSSNRKVGYNFTQSHNSINEFYDLLENSGVVNAVEFD